MRAMECAESKRRVWKLRYAELEQIYVTPLLCSSALHYERFVCLVEIRHICRIRLCRNKLP
jgi:hypothetical protein